MKNKNRTYILLVAVTAVWGTIGYKLYSNMNPSTEKAMVIANTDFKRIQTSKGEQRTIQPDYRDPFLGKIYRKKVRPTTKKKTIKKDPIIFPPIEFIGIISGNTNSFIIQINGQQEIFKKGQTHQGVMLQKGDTKSVIIRYKGASKTITRMQ
ncbi:hypothetical protein RQM59_02500 [Flavobacteriaceae bacterium S356]|uniref:Type IV pilus biogenesis protein PilP n=1 Tax=Asprobacillus argus TaxID=3076534 RepID=A0ABU3LBY0_9FLAO|nr:hypothetical protein [Flavobacteriaceae bacterium S356]